LLLRLKLSIQHCRNPGLHAPATPSAADLFVRTKKQTPHLAEPVTPFTVNPDEAFIATVAMYADPTLPAESGDRCNCSSTARLRQRR